MNTNTNTNHVTPTTPQAVSRALKLGGVTTQPDRRREGVRTSRSALGEVHVVIDIDGPSARRRMTEDVTSILDAAGYVWRFSTVGMDLGVFGQSQNLYVSGKAVRS